MKKIKLNSRLQLNKETIAKLNNNELNNLLGGQAVYPTFNAACTDHCTESDFCCTGSYAEPCKWTTANC